MFFLGESLQKSHHLPSARRRPRLRVQLPPGRCAPRGARGASGGLRVRQVEPGHRGIGALAAENGSNVGISWPCQPDMEMIWR